MPAPNAEALKLPDPLLVRFYRSGEIEKITKVSIAKKTRDVTIELGPDRTEHFKHLADVGWVPDA